MHRTGGVLEADSDGVIFYANGNARRLLGDDLLGRCVDTLSPDPAAHRRYREEYMRAPSVRTMVGRQVTAVRTDGKLVQVHVGLLPVSGGRLTVVVSDAKTRIVEQDAAAEHIRTVVHALEGAFTDLQSTHDSGAVFEDVLDTAPIVMVVGDGPQWWGVSRHLAAHLGRERCDLERMPWDRVVHPDDRSATAASYQYVLDTGDEGVLSNRLQHADGSYLRVYWRLGPRGGKAGMVAAVGEVASREQ